MPKIINPERKKSVHSGHRSRLKSKVVKGDSSYLEPHELLEVLLFYSIPRINTNEIAHEVLESFGSVSEVFNATGEDLQKMGKIGQSSAALIIALGEAYRRKELCESPVFNNIRWSGIAKKDDRNLKEKNKKCIDSIKNLSVRMRKEGMYSVVITEKEGFLWYLGENSVRDVARWLEKLNRNLFGFYAKGIVLIKYTKEKNAIPTSIELEQISAMRSVLNERSVDLYEYFIVSGDCEGNIDCILSAKDKCSYNY